MDTSRKHAFTALDGFRGLVAMMVCLHHTQDYWHVQVPRASITVDLFFLLGGFVVAYSYENKLLSGRINFRDFVLIRMIRLYPLYLVSLALISLPILAALFLHHNRPDYIIGEYVSATVLSVFMLPMRISADTQCCYPLNVVYWSLFWALATNFLYARLVRWLTTRVLCTVAVMSAVALTVMTIANGGIGMGPNWGYLSVTGGMVRALFGMTMGVLLFRHYRSLPNWLLGSGGWVLPLALVAAMIWLPARGAMDWVLQLVAVFVVFPWSIARAARGPQPAGDRVLQVVGFVSYPIYVLHMPVAHLLEMVAGKDRLMHYAPFSGMILVTILISLALAADRLLDRPIRAWLTAKLFGPLSQRNCGSLRPSGSRHLELRPL